MNVVILLGAPGSGKGTLAAELAKVPGIRHLSSGDLLRGAVKAGTPAGLKAKEHMEAGTGSGPCCQPLCGVLAAPGGPGL